MSQNTPKTIKILLADGTPSGIKVAEIGGRVVKAILVPRNKVKEASVREELNGVGLYFLVGQDPDMPKPQVYIGEAENVYSRILQHNADEKKDFWNIVICFVSTSSSITKAHVKCLESRSYDQAKELDRCEVLNSTSPAKAHLPEVEQAEADDFFEGIKLLIATLGYPIFDDITEIKESEKLYFCTGPSADAKGKYSDEGLVVFKGSLARSELTNTAGDWVKGMHERLIAEGVLQQEDEESYSFTQNYIFNSPSAAAAVVLARRANGWLEWKDEDGNTLDKNERQ